MVIIGQAVMTSRWWTWPSKTNTNTQVYHPLHSKQLGVYVEFQWQLATAFLNASEVIPYSGVEVRCVLLGLLLLLLLLF